MHISSYHQFNYQEYSSDLLIILCEGYFCKVQMFFLIDTEGYLLLIYGELVCYPRGKEIGTSLPYDPAQIQP
jgi:hypothetical protein